MSATALLFAASAGAMMAQEGVSVSIDRFFIAPGGTATVYVNMDNDVDVSSVTGTIVLPEEATPRFAPPRSVRSRAHSCSSQARRP